MNGWLNEIRRRTAQMDRLELPANEAKCVATRARAKVNYLKFAIAETLKRETQAFSIVHDRP
jgi:hypothetical protein